MTTGENEQPPRPPESEGADRPEEESLGPSETEVNNHLRELSQDDLEHRKQALQRSWSPHTPHIKKEINRIDAELRRRETLAAAGAPLGEAGAEEAGPRAGQEGPSEPGREAPPAEPPRRRRRERGPEGPEGEPFEKALLDAVRREAHGSLTDLERRGRLSPADSEVRRARIEQATEVRVNGVFNPDDGRFVDLVYDLEATTPEGERKVVPGRVFHHDYYGPLAELAASFPNEVRARLIDAFERERDFRSHQVRTYERQLATAQEGLAAATAAKERARLQVDVERLQKDFDRNQRIFEKLPDLLKRVKRRENVFGERPEPRVAEPAPEPPAVEAAAPVAPETAAARPAPEPIFELPPEPSIPEGAPSVPTEPTPEPTRPEPRTPEFSREFLATVPDDRLAGIEESTREIIDGLIANRARMVDPERIAGMTERISHYRAELDRIHAEQERRRAGAVPPAERPIPPVFEMPPSPDETVTEAAARLSGAAAEPAPPPQPETVSEQELRDRLAAAEARYQRSLFGLPVSATAEELAERVRQSRLARLGLPPDADAATIEQAEQQWQEREAALPELDEEPTERDLQPYYELYGLPPGSGIDAIRHKEQQIIAEREAVTAAPGAEAPAPLSRAAAPTAEEARAAAEPDERDRIAAELRGKPHADLMREMHERARDVTALEFEQAESKDPIRRLEIERRLREHRTRLLAIRDEMSRQRSEREREAVREAAPERLDELITGALEGPPFRDQRAHRGNLETLRAWRNLAEAARTEQAEQEVWHALLAIYETRRRETESPADAAALRDSYRGLIRRGGYNESVRTNARLLDTISTTLSFEDGLAAYRELAERMGDLRHFDETDPNRIPPRVADEIGEAWLAALRARVAAAERSPDRAHLEDPRLFGRLESVFETPATPETLIERLRAADLAAGILRGERSLQEAEAFLAPHGRDTLTVTRAEYARALMGRGSIFRRTSSEKLTELRDAYTAALEGKVNAHVREKIDQSRRDLGTPERISEADAEAQAAIVEAVLQYRHEETSALREAMRDADEKTTFKQFARLWRRHAALRTVVGLGLSGGLIASAATGNFLSGGILQAMKSTLSGMSAGMATEGIAEKSRERFGETKKISDRAVVAAMSDDELKRRLAAHTVRSAQYRKGVYEQALGRQTTVDLLTAEFGRRETERLRGAVAEMRDRLSTDEVVEAITEHTLAGEHSLFGAYESRRDRDRSFAVNKWLGVAISGTVVGLLTHGIGTRRIHELERLKAAKEGAALGAGRLAESAAEATHAAAPADTLGSHPAVGFYDTLTHHPAAPDATVDTLHTATADTAHAVQPDTLHTVPGGAAAPDTTGVVPQHEIPIPRDSTLSGIGSGRELYEGQLKDAVIRKSEGIEHALRRQLEAAPEKYGFHGDASDARAVHDWSGGEAHRIALREGLVNTNGEELRVAFDANHPAQFVLGGDGSVHAVGAETYAYHADKAADAVAFQTPTVESPAPEVPSDIPAVPATDLQEGAATESPHGVVAHGVEFGGEPIELTTKAESAYTELERTIVAFRDSIGKHTLAELQHNVEAQPAHAALKRSALEQFIDRQEGADHEIAKKYAKALETLFKRLPKESIGERDTIGSVLRRLAVKGVPPKMVAV